MTAARPVSSQPDATRSDARPGECKPSPADDGLLAFMSVRRRLFGIAYRMLGSAAEAEDVVQDAWLRWQIADRSAVRDAAAFLAATTTRLAINVMQSARLRRETCAGSGLTEPVDASAGPGVGVERGEGLNAGILLLLEKLSPTERAAYILREAFDYTYREIAIVLRLAEANARQVVTRARRHVADERRVPADASEQRGLREAFVAAAHHGDVASLEGWLFRGCRAVWTQPGAPAAREVPCQRAHSSPLPRADCLMSSAKLAAVARRSPESTGFARCA